LAAAYFAASESAFSSMNRVRIQLLADEGNKKAKKAIAIADKFDRAITTLLIGNNIAHIGCASLSTIVALDLWGGIYGEGTVATVSTVVTTVIVFLCSEMIPKSFAKANAEKLALSFAGSFTVIMKILTPVAFIFTGISKLFTMLFPAKEEPTYSEEELVSLIETVEEEGVIDEESSEILQSAIEFSSTTVKDVMTVRDDIFAIEVHTPIAQIKRLITETNHTRVPVYDTTLDKIVGILNVRTFLKTYMQKKGKFNIRTILTKPCPASADSPIDELFDKMRKNKLYIAVVKDDIDATLGIATIEDFLEEIVGEIFDEDDEVNDNFVKLGGFNYEVSGSMNVGETFMLLRHKTNKPSVMAKNVRTWVVEMLGHTPEEDESFVYEDALEVRVAEVDEGSVIKVEIKQLVRERELLENATVSDNETDEEVDA
jgi:CBS domain containing-hemolysin-like protein